MRCSLAIAREAAPTAGLVPLSAAGRQPLFFFGSLTDRDVLAYVLGRPVDLDDLQPATLAGFRRVRLADASYPMLVADAAGEVEGVLLRRASARDIRRLNHLESEEYLAEQRPVRLTDGTLTEAWLYLALDHLVPSEEAWELEAWVLTHKPGFFAACDGWMASLLDE